MYGHNPADLPYRFQRVSPIHVSPHDPDVVYHTSQYVHKTTDNGVTWETISPDLTAFEPDKQVISGNPITRDITGEEFYSTIYAIRESPVKAGVIWVGANDGPVHVTQDGGATWTNVTPAKQPTGGRVDAVEPSPHDPAKAYFVTLRYQLGDPKPYIYKTTNYGKNWTLLTTGSNGIPADYPVRVVREDPFVSGLLYAGTEYGMYISTDDGKSWQSFQQNLPLTPITDIKLVKEDLVLSTMGRGFYVLDDLSSLRQAVAGVSVEPVLFEPRTNIRYRYPSTGDRDGYPRSVTFIDYYLPSDSTDAIALEIFDASGNKVNGYVSGGKDSKTRIQDMGLNLDELIENRSLETGKGMHRFTWDISHFGPWDSNKNRSMRGGPMAGPGLYTIKLTVGDKSYEQQMKLVTDPRITARGVTDEVIASRIAFDLKVRDLLSEMRQLEDQLEKKLKEAKGDEKTALEALKKKVVTEEGTYMQPMLSSQVQYLYYLTNGSDDAPGGDAMKQYENLVKQVEEIKAELNN